MLVRRVLLAASVLLNIVFIYNLIWGESGVISYKELKARHSLLSASYEKIQKNNDELSQEINLLQSDEKYLEKVIRNRMNFVRDNEILYVFPSEQPTDHAGVSPDERKN